MAPRKDPVTSSRFVVKAGDKLNGTFRECTIDSSEHNLVEHKFVDEEGHSGAYAIPGTLKSAPKITLKRGLTDDNKAMEWREQIAQGQVGANRRNVTIMMLDQDGSTRAQYDLLEAWPLSVKITGGNANSNEVIVEEIQLVGERIKRLS